MEHSPAPRKRANKRTSTGGSKTGGRRLPHSKKRKGESVPSAFDLLDLDGTGMVAANELRGVMSALGYEDKSEDIRRIIADLETGPDGLVDVHQFEQAFTALLTEKDMHQEIERAFKLFDVDRTGIITLDSLRRVAQEIGEKLSEEDLREMILLADRANVGGVLYDDFYLVMTSSSSSS